MPHDSAPHDSAPHDPAPHDPAVSRSGPIGDDRPIRLRPLVLALLAIGISVLPLHAAVMVRQLGLGEAWAAACAAIGIASGS